MRQLSVEEPALEKAILGASVARLNNAAAWYVGEIKRVAMTNYKLADFKKLYPIQEQAITPDLEQLDKLMRYQTTLQRQLSTAVGELLVLSR